MVEDLESMLARRVEVLDRIRRLLIEELRVERQAGELDHA